MTSTSLAGNWLGTGGAQAQEREQPARPGARRATPLALQLRSDAEQSGAARLAAHPPRARIDAADGVTLWLTLPAAGRHNTEVIWDEAEQRASVAVWARDVRRRNKGRMLAYTSFWLPEHEGSRTEATLGRGVVTLRVPRRRAAA